MGCSLKGYALLTDNTKGHEGLLCIKGRHILSCISNQLDSQHRHPSSFPTHFPVHRREFQLHSSRNVGHAQDKTTIVAYPNCKTFSALSSLTLLKVNHLHHNHVTVPTAPFSTMADTEIPKDPPAYEHLQATTASKCPFNVIGLREPSIGGSSLQSQTVGVRG